MPAYRGRSGQAMFLQQARRAPITRDAWVQYWAASVVKPMPAGAGEAAMADSVRGGSCLCDPTGPPGICWSAAPASPRLRPGVVIVSPNRPGVVPQPWPKLADRFTVWREGKRCDLLEPAGARILPDRAERGDRPWVPVVRSRSGRPTSCRRLR